MAVIYRAQIHPTKLELIGSWLSGERWFGSRSVDGLASLGAFRFDDPAGEVGIETILVDVAGEVVQVPMTYRGAPLAGAEASLIGTMEHSVLGRRWVYDACGDAVYANELAAAILTGRTQVDEFVETDDGPTLRASSATVKGTGSVHGDVASVAEVGEFVVSTANSHTTITAPAWELTVARVVDTGATLGVAGAELLGTWAGQVEPVRLATARRTA